MIIKTKESASWLIGAVAGICTAVAMVVAGTIWWLVLAASLLVFVAVSLFALWMIVKYVAYKLRPIYSMVLSREVHTGDVAAELKDKKVDDISVELDSWAEGNDREIARLKEAEKLRKQYLGNVAHELKTPIFNIQGYISTLLDGGLEDEVINLKYLERAEKSVERMINILGDLDTISRLDSDMNQMHPESFDMVALCKDFAEQAEMEAAKRNITLQVKGADNLPSSCWVSADKFYIGQVLENLIVNSIRYGKEGGLTKITCRDMLDKVLVEVEDNGIGIAKSDLPRVFERFYRTDKGRSREQGGTGLGLAIVKHIIENHGEKVSVRSELGAGSTFTFTLKKVKL
jgi:two-component system phosphate regulon sensor histidine kinase PhoR